MIPHRSTGIIRHSLKYSLALTATTLTLLPQRETSVCRYSEFTIRLTHLCDEVADTRSLFR